MVALVVFGASGHASSIGGASYVPVLIGEVETPAHRIARFTVGY